MQRLYVPHALARGMRVELEGARAHYLANVLRLKPGHAMALFNGGDGEWQGVVHEIGRHRAVIELTEQRREARPEPGPTLVMAPIRPSRFDWAVEKAVELGVAAIQPVLTRRSVVKLERIDRLAAIATEAAEQCGRLTVPRIASTVSIETWLGERDGRAPLLFADESGGGRPLFMAVGEAGDKVQILIGPEGGFTDDERGRILRQPGAVPVDLGPLILRAETAALASLAIYRAARQLAAGGL